MNLLAFDTSSETLSVAAAREGKILAEGNFSADTRHSEHLVATLESIVKKAGWRPKDIDCIAVGVGPGSFTGLRVGVMTAKVLAYALGKKLVGVSSFEAVARAADFRGRMAVLLDAKRGNVYAGVYEKKGAFFKTLEKPRLATKDEVLKRSPRVLVVGGAVFPRASFIAEAAWPLIQKKKFNDPFTLEPLYLRPRDCNVHV
ncbi:MAG: tRNA (adenosine(37)-N6)-threonylcarbamoyltransferase complex dimerization subunit type 1 TsaB [Candidatus Omnitrophica bacterium]|nr:tRNA (adenosine(37)-N6)-threonylcarbamoyltransferase complex dimerization subunit type 1 TsaB [Candidatus Omnitrophota bacterium]